MQHTFNSNDGETTSDFISRVDNEVARLNQEWSNQNLAEKISVKQEHIKLEST